MRFCGRSSWLTSYFSRFPFTAGGELSPGPQAPRGKCEIDRLAEKRLLGCPLGVTPDGIEPAVRCWPRVTRQLGANPTHPKRALPTTFHRSAGSASQMSVHNKKDISAARSRAGTR